MLALLFGAKQAQHAWPFAVPLRHCATMQQPTTVLTDVALPGMPVCCPCLPAVFSYWCCPAGLSLRNLDAVGLKNIFHMLQQHYVEHLDKLYMVNASSIFWGLWKVVSPFIDPVTRAKIVFLESTDAMVQDLGPEVGVLAWILWACLQVLVGLACMAFIQGSVNGMNVVHCIMYADNVDFCLRFKQPAAHADGCSS